MATQVTTRHRFKVILATSLAISLLTAPAGYAAHTSSKLTKISHDTLDRYNLTLADAVKLIGTGTTSTPASSGNSSGGTSAFTAAAEKCLPIPTPNYMSPSVGEVDSPSFSNSAVPASLGLNFQLTSSAYPSAGNGEAEAAKLPVIEACLIAPIKALFVSASTKTNPISISNFSGHVVNTSSLPKGAYALKYTGVLTISTTSAYFEMFFMAVGHGNAVALYTMAVEQLGKYETTPDYTKLENAFAALAKSKVSKVSSSAL